MTAVTKKPHDFIDLKRYNFISHLCNRRDWVQLLREGYSYSVTQVAAISPIRKWLPEFP